MALIDDIQIINNVYSHLHLGHTPGNQGTRRQETRRLLQAQEEQGQNQQEPPSKELAPCILKSRIRVIDPKAEEIRIYFQE